MHDLFAQLPTGDWIATAIFGVGMAILIMLLISRGIDGLGRGLNQTRRGIVDIVEDQKGKRK